MKRSRGVALLAAMAALGLAAASAYAGVTVYKNNFSSKAESRELKHVDGKHCHTSWQRKSGSLRVDVTKGPNLCGYRPPVQGDTAGPDLKVLVTERVRKTTPKGIRDGTFVDVEVRRGKTTAYDLRVFPSKHQFKLRRRPSGGGQDFPVKGRNHAIKGINHNNALQLSAVGAKVIGKANGKRLFGVKDSNPAQVSGRTVEVGIGEKRHTSKTASGTLDDLRVQVPKP